MNNDIRDILKNYPFLINLYQKNDLLHIRNIYFDHLTHKRIIETFDFIKFIAKLHELGYKPHEYSIIRFDTTKPFSETNIHLKKANSYQKKLEKMSKVIKETERHKVKIKLNNDPYIIVKSENLTKKPEYKLHTKQHSPTSTTDDLIRYYSKTILKKMRESYSNKKRTHLIADGFSFEKYVKKVYALGYLDSYSHQVRRIDTKKPFSEENIYLKKTDGLLKKIENMSEIVHRNKRVALKIDEQNPFQICLKHPNAKWERRIYIKQ